MFQFKANTLTRSLILLEAIFVLRDICSLIFLALPLPSLASILGLITGSVFASTQPWCHMEGLGFGWFLVVTVVTVWRRVHQGFMTLVPWDLLWHLMTWWRIWTYPTPNSTMSVSLRKIWTTYARGWSSRRWCACICCVLLVCNPSLRRWRPHGECHVDSNTTWLGRISS